MVFSRLSFLGQFLLPASCTSQQTSFGDGRRLITVLAGQAGRQEGQAGWSRAGQDRAVRACRAGKAGDPDSAHPTWLPSTLFHETLCFLLKNPSQVLMSTDVLNLVWVYLFQKKQEQPWSTVFQRREHNCKMNDHIWATIFGHACISFWCHFVDILQQPLILQTKGLMS